MTSLDNPLLQVLNQEKGYFLSILEGQHLTSLFGRTDVLSQIRRHLPYGGKITIERSGSHLQLDTGRYLLYLHLYNYLDSEITELIRTLYEITSNS